MPDKPLVNLSAVSITIDGKGRDDLEADLEELVVDQTYNLPSMLTIRVHDPDFTWVDDSSLKIGVPVKVKLFPAEVLGMPKGNEEVFDGEIVSLEPEFNADGQHELVIRGYDRGHRLHFGRYTQTYTDMTDSDIVAKVAKVAGLTAKTDTTTVRHKYVLQYNQTNMEFLTERARRIGFQLYVKGSELYFVKPTSAATVTLDLGTNLRSFRLRASAAHQAKEHEVRGWDVEKKQPISAKKAPEQFWSKNGLNSTGAALAQKSFGASTQVVVDHVITTADEAKAIVEARARDQEGHFIEAEGVCYGAGSIRAGIYVKLTGMGKRFSGEYFVTNATHIYARGSYETHITVTGRYPQTVNNLLHPQAPLGAASGRIYGMVVGLVTNVHGDPLKIGRVEVKYPWLATADGAEVASAWARIASPFAGAERGFYFLPEVNDEVLIAFEHGDVNYPYIIGVLWNGKDKPPEANATAHANGKTIHRIIKTRLGHRVVFDDSDDKTSILIEDKSGKQRIFIDTVKNTVTILADSDITIKSAAGNLTLEAAKNVTIKAGMALEASAGTNMKLDAKANADITAGVNLVAEGKTMANLKASAAIVEGQSSVWVKASGPTVVEGKPIMLN